MGLFDKLSGNGSPDVEAAVDTLEAGLPDGWSFKGLQDQLVGRRPVKHETFGAWAKGPDGTVAALALDPVAAVQELGRLVAGGATVGSAWAPPALDRRDEKHREPWPALTDTDEEDAARARLEAVLPEGAVLSPRDQEKFGPFTIQALTVHLPDGTGVAAMTTEAIGAYDAMIARLRGELAETPTWCLRR